MPSGWTPVAKKKPWTHKKGPRYLLLAALLRWKLEVSDQVRTIHA